MATTLDKLTIIAAACNKTGLSAPGVENDGSPEWECGSDEYDLQLGVLVEEHPWNFLTKTETLVAVSPVPSPLWTYAWAKPGDCVHLRRVMLDARYVVDYEVVGSAICANVTGTLTAEYVSARDNETTWRYGFVRVLQLYVEAALLRLKEDFGEANNREKMAEKMLGRARTRNDQEQPPRRGFQSSLLLRRTHGIRPRR